MMRDKLEAILAGLVFVIILAAVVAAAFAGGFLVYSTIYSGTVLEYEGTVQAVTRSSFLAPHTKVVLRTYSEDDVHFTLGGYHDFDIGSTIEIRMIMMPYVYGLYCWGIETEITVVERPGAEG